MASNVSIELTTMNAVHLQTSQRLDTDSLRSEKSATSVLDLDQQRAGTKESAVPELPRVDGGWDAWQFILIAFVLENCVWGYSFSYGVTLAYLSTNEPFSSSSIAAISSVGTISLAIEYMLPGPLMIYFRRYPDFIKPALWIAMGVSTLSMFASSFANEVWQLIVLQGVLCGAAGAVLYCPVLMWLNEWFVMKRGMATGFVFAGTGVGGFVFPFLIGGLLDRVGFAWTFRAWSLITLVLFAISIKYLRPRFPIPSRPRDRGAFVPVDLRFLLNPIVIVMFLTTFVSSLGFFPVSLYLPTYAASLAIPASALSGNSILAVYNAATVVGQVFTGFMSDRWGYGNILAALGVAGSLTAFLGWGFADTLAKVFIFSVLFGAFSGVCSIWSAVGRDVSGLNSQSASLILSTFSVSRGLASIIGPIIASVLYHPGGFGISSEGWGQFGFRDVIVFVGTMALASAFGGLGLRLLSQRRGIGKRLG